jgi:Leucine-rich repeat (LRR) protein
MKPWGPRDEVDPRYYDRPGMKEIEFRTKSVAALVVRDDLVPNVTRIRLVDCALRQFPTGLTSYVNITTLDLSENQLSEFARGAFLPFVKLDGLDLTSNAIKKFAVDLPPSLTKLHLSFNPKLDIESVWSLTAPGLDTLWITHSNLTSLPDKVPPWAQGLKVLRLDCNDFNSVPPILDKFPSLDEVSFFGNTITTITGLTFERPLKQLSVAFNSLRSFHKFKSLTVTALGLSSNRFRSFPLHVLEVSELRQLSIARCRIRDILDFELPPTLASLDVSHNRISGVSERFATSMRNLSILNISSNLLASLPDSFPEDHRLTTFIADNNRLETLPLSLLKGSKLENFNISCNLISSFASLPLTKLRNVNLSFNRLATLPDIFSGAAFLTDLNLSFNALTTLPMSLGSCRRLATLVVASNQLRRIPEVTFSCPQLKSLSLSGNLLSSLPEAFTAMRFLRTLDLSNNHFGELPAAIGALRGLRVLSLSHNAIAAIPAGFDFPRELTLLDLSFNKLPQVSLALPQLRSLSLDYNELTSFDPSGVPNCRFLALSCNPLAEPLPAFLPRLSGSQVHCLEYICGDAAPFAPPRDLHALHASTALFPKNFAVGYAGTLGERPSMEDAVLFHEFSDEAYVCGVFDGHTGP